MEKRARISKEDEPGLEKTTRLARMDKRTRRQKVSAASRVSNQSLIPLRFKKTNPYYVTKRRLTAFQHWLNEHYWRIVADAEKNGRIADVEARHAYAALRDRSKWEAMAREDLAKEEASDASS